MSRWKEKYRLGVDLIDQQHEELFERVSAFITVVRSAVPWEEKVDQVKDTMAFMQEYVVFHFEDEEAYQERIGYPDLENHKRIHAQFKTSVQTYAERMESEGYTEDLVKEFSGKLMAWLIMHVAGVDQKLGTFATGLEENSNES